MTAQPLAIPPPGDGFTRLIYYSRQALRYDADVGAVVNDIVCGAVARNRPVGVTGLLLVHDGWFVQALEGLAGAVRGAYDRIASDRRHVEVSRVCLAPAKARCARGNAGVFID